MNEKIVAVKKLVRGLFKDSKGNPFEMTDGQALIFLNIIDPKIKWLWLSAPSRYGKSNILALAILYLAAVKKLKIPIVGGSTEKARKIMEYILQHIADSPIFYNNLINIEGIKNIERLKIQVSKNVLRWSNGGWIYVTSVDSRQISREGEGVVGEGGHIIVLEEAGLIREKEQYSKIVRMMENKEGWGKLIQSGNCVEKSVFEDAYNDDLFVKVKIDLKQALAEGRFTEQELAEKKTQTTSRDWKRYYEVEFPQASEFAYFKPKQYEFLPELKEVYGAVDLALGESKTGSLVGITVIGKDAKGQAYCIKSIGEHLTPDETIRQIFNLPYKFKRFGIEAVQFQKYFLQTIDRMSKEQGLYIPFEGIQQKRKKEERIESLEPIVNTGIILFSGGDIIYEHLANYPDCPLDVLDSLEMCCRIAGIVKHTSFQFDSI